VIPLRFIISPARQKNGIAINTNWSIPAYILEAIIWKDLPAEKIEAAETTPKTIATGKPKSKRMINPIRMSTLTDNIYSVSFYDRLFSHSDWTVRFGFIDNKLQ
jgi:hypothetical protein